MFGGSLRNVLALLSHLRIAICSFQLQAVSIRLATGKGVVMHLFDNSIPHSSPDEVLDLLQVRVKSSASNANDFV